MAEKGLFIEQLQSGGVATLQALVKVKELRPKRSGGFYLRLLLGDRTGELEAKVWDLCRSRHRSHYSDFEAMPSQVCIDHINGFLASRSTRHSPVSPSGISVSERGDKTSLWLGSRDDTVCVESGWIPTSTIWAHRCRNEVSAKGVHTRMPCDARELVPDP
jgi:hypothetical protein